MGLYSLGLSDTDVARK